MKRNTTFNLPDGLLQRAKTYAAEHGTSVTAIVKRHLEQVTGFTAEAEKDDPIAAFSRGEIGKESAIEQTGVRDYAELLIALGKRGLDLPSLPPHEVREMTDTFLRLRGSGTEARQ